MEKICGICRRERADESERAGDPNARWEETEHTNNARLWTSSLLRTIQTAAHIEHPTTNDGEWEQMAPRLSQHRRNLRRGLRGDDPEEIAEKHPQAAYLRSMDKIGYRYPRGESYFDLISRLEPCIQEMESYHGTRPRRQSPSHPALDLRLSHRRRSRTRAGNEHLLPKRRLRDHARRVVKI